MGQARFFNSFDHNYSSNRNNTDQLEREQSIGHKHISDGAPGRDSDSRHHHHTPSREAHFRCAGCHRRQVMERGHVEQRPAAPPALPESAVPARVPKPERRRWRSAAPWHRHPVWTRSKPASADRRFLDARGFARKRSRWRPAAEQLGPPGGPTAALGPGRPRPPTTTATVSRNFTRIYVQR